MAISFVEQGLRAADVDAKIRCFTQAWEADETYAVAAINLATAYQKKGKTDDAVRLFQAALEIAEAAGDAPAAAQALFGLGDVAYEGRRYGTAWEYYRKGLVHSPGDPETKSRIATLKKNMPQYFTSDGEFLFKDRDQIAAGLQLKRGTGVVPRSDGVDLPIPFEYDSDGISTEAELQMAALEEAVKTLALGIIVINGHCDSRGDPEYNLRLSRRRAESVKRRLMKATGFPAGRFRTNGFGFERPVVPDARTEADHQKNRRVEVALEAK
ncbi:MAG TPA: OmpA family protein [Candidatus Ozemobacteraceae bacterium]|nr:OmpA family protein [Candidatus Ozemobacteraceae bacterium]